MIRILTLLFAVCAAAPLAAQTAVYLDLSDPWRFTGTSDPAMASPDYADSHWKLRSPADWSVFAWMRRSIDLPEGADRHHLALSLGAIRGNYAVFINGRHIATSGSMDTAARSEIPRPHTFAIPFGTWRAGPRQVIAIQAGPMTRPTVVWKTERPGSFLLTYLEQAPVQEGADMLALRREQLTPMLVIAAIYLMLCIPLAMAWWTGRQRWELLWLCAYLIMSAAYAAQAVLSLRPDVFVFNQYGIATVQGFTHYGTFATYGSFVIAALSFRSRWPHVAHWLAFIGLQISFSLNVSLLFYYHLFANLFTLSTVAVAVWRLWREGAPRLRFLLPAALALPVIERQVSLTVARSNVGERIIPLLGYRIPLSHLMTLLLTSVILYLVLRQVTKDRREQQRLKGELDAARGVQALMLGTASAGAFEIDAVYEPAQEVGGDFHWTRTTSEGALIVVVGDVSGKGLKAAMLVSVAVGILQNEKSSSPGGILGSMNGGLTAYTGGGFVTCCCARFDADGTVTLANAGHPAPYCDGHEIAVEPGLPIGIVTGADYAESVSQGTSFTFVSDGVVEAAGAKGELFGFERTRAISGKSAQEIAEAAKAWGQNDDITVVTVRRIS